MALLKNFLDCFHIKQHIKVSFLEYCEYFCNLFVRIQLNVMTIKFKLPFWAAILIGIFSFASCASDENNTTATNNGSNCAIKTAVLGTLTRTVNSKTNDGRDTTYSVAVAGSVYRLHIDQLKQEIYNTDSLPENTDLKRVTFAALSGDGLVMYRTKSGRDTTFSTTDSIDFTAPRYFTCYSDDGTQSRTYKVTINVHKSQSEVFSWNTVAEGNAAFEGVSAQKMFVMGDQLVIIAIKDAKPVALVAKKDAPDAWTVNPVSGIESIVPGEVLLFDGKMCYIEDGTLKTSTDGVEWTTQTTDVALDRVVALSKIEVFAIGGDKIYSSSDLAHWEEDTADDDASMLPVSNIATTCGNLAFNDNFYYSMVCGTAANGESVIWKKTIDKTGVNTEPWVIYPQSDIAKYNYPSLEQSIILNYDDRLICLGAESGTVSPFYISTDAGRNWIPSSNGYNRPEGLECSSFSVATDTDNFVWIATAPEGKVVKGRLNRLSYEKQESVFTKNIAK